MHRLGRWAASWGGRLAVVTIAAAVSGCTMCPDPYDYSGPVPNGSAPQNNFRARSNGIQPLGATPRPWPPLVDGRSSGEGHQAGCRCGRRHGTPTLADPAVTQAAAEEPIPENTEPTSVLVAAVGDLEDRAGADEVAANDDVVEVIPEDVAAEDAAAVEPAAPAGTTEPEAFVLAEEEPPAETPAQPRLAETPGWRPRQAR